MTSRKWKKMLEALASEFGLVVTGGGRVHYKIARPTGETIATCSASPSDEHAILYIRKDIKRSLHNGSHPGGQSCP